MGRNPELSSVENEVKIHRREWQGFLGITTEDKNLSKIVEKFVNTLCRKKNPMLD